LASVLLIAGTIAAQRGRTWGVILALASASAFPVAWAIGIAPFWFCIVGIVGVFPFLYALFALRRFDKGATRIAVAIVALMGAVGAIGWKVSVYSIFETFFSLVSSDYA